MGLVGMLVRFRSMTWRDFWAGVAVVQAFSLVSLYIWFTFLRP